MTTIFLMVFGLAAAFWLLEHGKFIMSKLFNRQKNNEEFQNKIREIVSEAEQELNKTGLNDLVNKSNERYSKSAETDHTKPK